MTELSARTSPFFASPLPTCAVASTRRTRLSRGPIRGGVGSRRRPARGVPRTWPSGERQVGCPGQRHRRRGLREPIARRGAAPKNTTRCRGGWGSEGCHCRSSKSGFHALGKPCSPEPEQVLGTRGSAVALQVSPDRQAACGGEEWREGSHGDTRTPLSSWQRGL